MNWAVCTGGVGDREEDEALLEATVEAIFAVTVRRWISLALCSHDPFEEREALWEGRRSPEKARGGSCRRQVIEGGQGRLRRKVSFYACSTVCFLVSPEEPIKAAASLDQRIIMISRVQRWV